MSIPAGYMAIIVDPDQTPHSAASDLDLHYFAQTYLLDY